MEKGIANLRLQDSQKHSKKDISKLFSELTVDASLVEELKNIYIQNIEKLQSGTKCVTRLKQENESDRQDNSKDSNINVQLELNCRELSAKLKQVNDLKKKIEEEEKVKHEEFLKACEEGIVNAQQQIDNCQKENSEKEVSNQKLRDDIKQLIEGYDKRGQEILDQLKTLEESEKVQNQEMFDKYQMIQENFAESLKLKEQLQSIKKELNDHKFKIVLYDQRQKDFLMSLNQSLEMLDKVDQQLTMSLSKVKTLSTKQSVIKAQNDKSDKIMLELVNKINLQKDINNKQRQVKDELSQKCKLLQSQIKK